MWTNTRKSEKNIRRRLNKDILRSSFALPHGISTYLPTTSHEPPFLLLKTVENNHVILATLLSFPLLPPPPPLTHRYTPAHMGVKLQILVSASPQIMFFSVLYQAVGGLLHYERSIFHLRRVHLHWRQLFFMWLQCMHVQCEYCHLWSSGYISTTVTEGPWWFICYCYNIYLQRQYLGFFLSLIVHYKTPAIRT